MHLVRHGYRGPIETLNLADYPDEASREKKLENYNNYQVIEPAIVTTVNDEKAELQRRGSSTLISLGLKQVKWARTYKSENSRGPSVKKVTDVLKQGDVVWLGKNDKDEWELSQLPKVTGAITVVNPKDGAIEAMQGKKPTPPADWNDDDHSGKDDGDSGETATSEDPEAKDDEVVNAKPASSH